jgi:hypothetical protein
MIRNLIASVAAIGLAAAPAVAQSSASKLSIAQSARAGSAVEGEKLGGSTLLIVAAVAAAVALAVFVVFDDDDSESA